MNGLPCRLIIDPPQAGAWNMAVDEALLESAIDDGVATLRFYRWSEPTLSLGYFQKLADRAQHPASLGCPVVRRHSGGGAILHDREVTYSLALPPGSPPLEDAEQVYRRTHEALLATLAERLPEAASRFPANLCSAAIPPPRGAEPFLCFRRRARCDVLVTPAGGPADTVDGRHKVCGSAQRKRRGGLLQHGGCLLKRSERAPELPGVDELTGRETPLDPFVEQWAARIGDGLGLELAPQEITPEEIAAARRLLETKFAADAWTGRR